MKRNCLCSLLMMAMLMVSCDKFNPCVRGESKTECNTTTSVYIMNSTYNTIQVGNAVVQAAEKKKLTSMDTGVPGLHPEYIREYFGGDTVLIKFNDSVAIKHIVLRTDTAWVYIPEVHNIYDIESWNTGYNGDSWTSWAVYTVTETDYKIAQDYMNENR